MPGPRPNPRLIADALAEGRKRGLDKTAVAPSQADAPPPCMAPGTKVRVTHGDVPQMRADDAVVGERDAAGVSGRIDGPAYVAAAGPNKGDLIQPIREDGTGAVLGVPASRLTSETHVTSRVFGSSRRYAEAYEAAFGAKPAARDDGKWVQTGVGRRRLVK